MCGITGYITRENYVAAAQLIGATSSLSHRGPDSAGYYFSESKNVGLGHRRLSILDLREAANQPMFSSSGRYVIVFNGEIYNYQELKSQLPKVNFKTKSDTEVILELYAKYGPSSFCKLNGMFAFCIYDIEKNVATLCRDHAGVKPLFIYQGAKGIVFGSELKAILELTEENLELDKEAIAHFLHLGFIPHPLTIYQQVKKFEAGHYLQVDLNRDNFESLRSSSYWKSNFQFHKETMRDFGSAKSVFKNILFDAVERQLVSDVPIGTFLSGGIDSSLVTAVASRISSTPAKTFSIAIGDGKYNEAEFARSVASHLKTDHYEFAVQEEEVLDLVESLLPTYDEPFADSSAFPTMLVSKLAREHVTVALSGDGGDELFYGYGAYTWARRLNNPLLRYSRKPIALAGAFMTDRYKRAASLFDIPSYERSHSHIFSQEQYMFSEREVRSVLCKKPESFGNLNKMSVTGRQLDAVEKQALWDFKYYLPDDLLVKVDRASMQYGLEARVPLLDTTIIEFAFNLHRNLKLKAGEKKYFLKQVLFDFVPKELFDRPKWGFSIPLNKWLKGELRFLLDRYTSREVLEAHQIVQPKMVEKLKADYLAGRDYLFNRLWVIIVLHWWLEKYQAQGIKKQALKRACSH